MSTNPRTRAWVEVSGSALRRNLESVRGIVGSGADVLPVVKADGYGLGLRELLGVLEPAAPWGYGIETVQEGREIRSLGVRRPVLLLAPIPPGALEEAVASELRVAISSIEALKRVAHVASTAGLEAVIHTEIDTGIGRAGFDWRDADKWGPEVLALTGDGVRWEGVFTHFFSASDPETDSVAEQADRFADSLLSLGALGVEGWITHMCNSAALLRRPDLSRNLVRPGIFLYGGRTWPGAPQPEPVVSIRARVVLIRDVPPGTTLGYGATHRAERDERWATLGIGYGDGIPRTLGNGGTALVCGQRVPIIGRISMGMTVVDITTLSESSVDVGDEVTLLGEDRGERISLEEVARVSGTISYEVLTRLSPRLPRVWL